MAVSKQATQKIDGKIFNLRKLNDLEVKKQYQIEITSRFVALGNFSYDDDINRAWENVKDNIKMSAKESLDLLELKQHKPCFDGEYLGFLDQRQQAKMQWVQYPSQSNVSNLNKIKHEASKHFGNEKRNT